MAADPIPIFARLSSLFLRTVARCLARVRVEGLEHIPREGPLLIVCNHASNADGLLIIGFVLPRLGRPLHWPGKEEALHWPVLGWTMRGNGVFGIRRGAGDLEAFRTARKYLDEGRILAIFPEGTRSPTGALQDAKEGATVLALRSGAPILPIGIAGSHEAWPKGRLLPRIGRRITLRVGEPFHLEAAARGAARRDAMPAATRELMCHIAALLPPDLRGAYADIVETA